MYYGMAFNDGLGDDSDYGIRTFGEALEAGEFAVQRAGKLEQLQQRERAVVARQTRQLKLERRNPWLAEVAQAPRRRRSFN